MPAYGYSSADLRQFRETGIDPHNPPPMVNGFINAHGNPVRFDTLLARVADSPERFRPSDAFRLIEHVMDQTIYGGRAQALTDFKEWLYPQIDKRVSQACEDATHEIMAERHGVAVVGG